MAKVVRFSWTEDLDTLTVFGTDKVTGDWISFSYEEVSQVNRPRLVCFALKTILATRTSSADSDDKLDAMRDVKNLLGTDSWEKDREGGGFGVVSTFVEALAELKGQSIPAIQASLKKYSKEQREAMKDNAKVKAKMEEIEKARKDVAADSLSLEDLI